MYDNRGSWQRVNYAWTARQTERSSFYDEVQVYYKTTSAAVYDGKFPGGELSSSLTTS